MNETTEGKQLLPGVLRRAEMLLRQAADVLGGAVVLARDADSGDLERVKAAQAAAETGATELYALGVRSARVKDGVPP